LRSVVEVDVSDLVTIPGHHVVRGVVQTPTVVSDRPLVWCCLPGGYCTSAYFDLDVGDDQTSYSMAAHLAEAGSVVLALDHLGSGASSPLEDPFLLTPEILAAASHAAFTALLGRLREGSLMTGLPPIPAAMPIGLGHSMGAMITIIQQARYRTYRALVNLGGGGAGLPEHLSDPLWATWTGERLRGSLVELARVQFARAAPRERARPGLFHAEDVPPAVLAAFRTQLTSLLPSCALASILPGFSDDERAQVDVPLFLGFGQHDLEQNAHDSVTSYPSCADLTLFVLGGSGHCHNQAGNRHELWDRMLAWARATPMPSE
jgi:pimeloyl-ACP methyl ester carboxylesterase